MNRNRSLRILYLSSSIESINVCVNACTIAPSITVPTHKTTNGFESLVISSSAWQSIEDNLR